MLTVPLEGARFTLAPYPLPDEVETSNPVGAVTVMLVVRLVPETVKLCAADTDPEQDVKALKVPVVVIAGEGGTVQVNASRATYSKEPPVVITI